ncbi:transferase [Campylobacter coli]|nr:transferase [Campylobacter coli]EIY7319085.1 transferase [Campylobacter coli]EJD9671247.1 transferase [Campylobacter coli]EJL9317818.1 transferase [Campylobacter coli]EJM4848024.1 transferase [Campylobacter coli]
MKNVIIIGAGGFARELYSYLKDANYEIIGYIDIQENNFFDLKYLGNEDNFDKKLIQKASFALGVGQINLRKKILVKLSKKKKSCNFITFIHPQSFVSKEAKIGQGVIVCPFATINANSNIGDFVLCNIYSSIGKNCFLATRVSLLPCVNLEDNCIVSR